MDDMQVEFERIYLEREKPASPTSYNSLMKDDKGEYVHKYPADMWAFFQGAVVWALKDALKTLGKNLVRDGLERGAECLTNH